MMKLMLKNKSARLLFGVFAFLLLSGAAFSKDAGPTSVVYQVYKDYGWQALFSYDRESYQALGRPLAYQPKKILVRYFDEELANLLVQNTRWSINHPGDQSDLDFDMIFASQDTAASDLKITDAGNGKVNVEYTYPPDGQKIKLMFLTRKVKNKWRITDIDYGYKRTLKEILADQTLIP